MEGNRIKWIGTEGGPLILIPQIYLTDWQGVGDDYGRACAVNGYLGKIPVGKGAGLIIGDIPLNTAWLPLSEHSGILVRLETAEIEEGEEDAPNFLEPLKRVPPELWHKHDFTFFVPQGPLQLRDSAWNGKHLLIPSLECLVFELVSGIYSLETAKYQIDGIASLLLHRISLLET